MNEKRQSSSKHKLEPPVGEVTELLARVRIGQADSMSHLMDAVYARIHKIAAQVGAMNGLQMTLTPTALLHESFARILQSNGFERIKDRNHLYSTFAKTILDVLVDGARRKAAKKRGGGVRQVELDQILFYLSHEQSFELLELKDALECLAKDSARAATVVEMRFFGGFTLKEIAEALQISTATVSADWKFARARLAQILNKIEPSS